MNIVKTNGLQEQRDFGSMQIGTVFHYPNLSKLYMKVAGAFVKTGDFRDNALSLSDGVQYAIDSSKQLCPLPIGTVVTLEVNSSKRHCESCAA